MMKTMNSDKEKKEIFTEPTCELVAFRFENILASNSSPDDDDLLWDFTPFE